MGWVNYGRINVFRRGDHIVNMLITTKETSTLILVDVERFSGTSATCFLQDDVDNIIEEVKKLAVEEKYHELTRKIVGFIFEHHASIVKSAIRKCKEILRKYQGISLKDSVSPSVPSGGASGSRPSAVSAFPADIITIAGPPPFVGGGS